MFTEKISLSSIEVVKKFVCLANQYNFPINLVSEKYKIDAKSIMGIFSLDLSKPIELQVEDKDLSDELKTALEAFKVTQ